VLHRYFTGGRTRRVPTVPTMATKVRKGMACVVVVVVGAGRLSKLPTTDY
jgi:hypothetical protein